MCDRYAVLTANEPQVILFDDANCQGNARIIPPGLINNLNDGGARPGANNATAMVVPPHMYADVKSEVWNYNGGHGARFGPGVYPQLGNNFLSTNLVSGQQFYKGWSDDIDSINVVRSQSWDSWKDQCCRNEKDDSVCPAGFMHPNDSNCYGSMNAYCSSGANMWGNMCSQWGPNEQKKQEFCNSGTNFSTPQCKEWCMRRNPDGTTNFGKCDTSARYYCGPNGNPNDPICACINSQVTKYNPACVDAKCATGGYLTSTQSALQCPTIVDCSIVLDLQSKGVQTVGNISQNCTADGATNTSNTAPVTPVSQPESQEFSTANKIIVTLLLILITVIILAVLIGISYFTENSEKNKI